MKIRVGSTVFFKDYPDFKPHDTDYVLFEDNPKLYDKFAYIKERNVDVFAYKNMSKEEFIEFELKHCEKDGLPIAKLIVPEICKYMHLTIEDLKKFEFATKLIREKYNYVVMIYNFYIENNGIYLTQEQRNKAYEEYKKYRISK